MDSSLTRQTYTILAFLLFSCFCLSETNGVRIGEGEIVDGGAQREFDYFLLALIWPGTTCRRVTHCCKANGCCRSSNSPTEFTIHGLWSDYNDGTWPACCARTMFDVKEISSLLGALEKYWPSLSCSSTSTCFSGKGLFWAHEWEKHGTCSSSVTGDEYNYFLTTLNVYFKYNVTRILNDAGYVPSNSEKYPLGGIVAAIENAVGASPQLVCSHGAVEELRLCFYKDFKPRDCVISSSTPGDMLTSQSSCPSYISLPEYTPLETQNIKTAVPWILERDMQRTYKLVMDYWEEFIQNLAQ